MKALAQPRPGGGPRDEVIEIEPHGKHQLRAPTFSGAAVALMVHTAVKVTAAEPTWTAHRQRSPIYGAVIGLCWWHADFELDAPRPRTDEPLDRWADYGDAVCGELLDQGYTIGHILTLYNAAIGLVDRVHRIINEGQQQADFTPGAGETTEPPNEPPIP